MTDKLNSNYGEFSGVNIPSNQKVITLRQSPLKGDDPITWSELDNNFELLRYTINSLIDEIPTQYYTKAETDGRYEVLGTSYSKQNIDSRFNNIYVKSEIDATIDNFYTKYEMDVELEEYYTKAESDEKYVTVNSGTFTNLQSNQANANAIAEVKTEHPARNYVREDVMIKWSTSTTESQIAELTGRLSLTFSQDVPLTSFKLYKLPVSPRHDAAYVMPVLKTHEYVEEADFNGISSAY